MKNKEESSTDSLRGNPSSTEETTGSLSRPGLTVAAQVEQPALSLFPETLMEAVVDRANMETAWKNVKPNAEPLASMASPSRNSLTGFDLVGPTFGDSFLMALTAPNRCGERPSTNPMAVSDYWAFPMSKKD
jgi:hypothetical protein